MLREEDKLTETLIQIIQSLPETKKEKIARTITKKTKPRANWAKLFKLQKKLKGKEKTKRTPGLAKGRIKMKSNFEQPVNDFRGYM